MSNDIDNYSIVRYLTAEGWKNDLKDVHPRDHIETWVEKVKLNSRLSPESSIWRMLWVNPNSTPENCALVHKKFPKPKR